MMTSIGSDSSRLASFSYILMILLVGVPIWWKTTEVYRVSLPYGQIEKLTSTVGVKVKVNVQIVSTDVHKEHQLGPMVQKELKGQSMHFSKFQVNNMIYHL